MTEQIVDILFWISTGLLAPTLLVLIVFMAATLVMLGGLLREALDRAIHLRAWRRFLEEVRLTGETGDEFYGLTLIGYPAAFQTRTSPARDSERVARKCLEDLELDMARRMAWLTFAVRVGPMLGLVGTLVPLGPALMGLAAGDIEALSGNLVIAFTTTVFGILVGGGAFAGNLVRRAWYEQDLSDLEYVVLARKTPAAVSLNFASNGHAHRDGSAIDLIASGADARRREAGDA